jgi:hypothetical protein
MLEPKTSVVDVYEEARRYFMGEGTLNKTLARLSNDLEGRGIDYMVIGAVALLAYGYPRFTEDIDLVMTAEGLQKFHEELVGLGIKVMTTGEYPGDGKPKPVSMPAPADASTEIDGIKFVTLEKLIELKLASGISAPDRLKDLADVQELIKIRKLDADFALKLDPYVRAKISRTRRSCEKSELIQEK